MKVQEQVSCKCFPCVCLETGMSSLEKSPVDAEHTQLPTSRLGLSVVLICCASQKVHGWVSPSASLTLNSISISPVSKQSIHVQKLGA